MASVASSSPPTRQEDVLIKPERVFGSESHRVDEFELLIRRVVRLHILQQYNEEGGITTIIDAEKELIQQSADAVLNHLSSTEGEWNGLIFRLRKIAIIRHLRELAKERMKDHVETEDLNEDVAQAALDEIFEEDFEWAFPAAWVDG